ncbi:MAG TPA: hypothetical protein VGH74_14010 [Planctomycetaceae bacterium]
MVQRLHKAKRTDAVIACINAALINGRSQPWMYTVLALEMERAGKPREDIERVLLSTVDFSAVNVSNILYSAAVLTRFGAKERALAMYRQASLVDPTRLESYAMGLRLAREAEDPEAVAWAATGILQRAWGTDYQKLHRDAEETARDMEAGLRKVGNDQAADRLAAALAEAAKRDLAIELSWSGKADLDLLVEEPSGAICSADNPVTMGGGIFVHDGFGGDQKDCYDKYVCPRGMSGDYRATVRHISGDVVGKRAVLEVVRYQGSSREIVDRFTIKLSDRDKVVRVTLQHGRLKELTAVPLLEAPREGMGTARGNRRERLARHSRDSQRAGAKFVEDRLRVRGGPGAPGYQPVITIIADGVTSTANAVVSGDRRYVRMSIVPTFSTLTDVQTFSFISAAGSNPNTTQAGGTGTGR